VTKIQKKENNEILARQFERNMEIMPEDLSHGPTAKPSKIPTTCAVKQRVPLKSIQNLVQVDSISSNI
jgi:hypothetical protein